MSESLWFILLVQVILIALNAVFASAEIAVLSINEVKLEKLAEQGNKRAARLAKLTRQPARFLATIQVAITLSGFLGSAFAAIQRPCAHGDRRADLCHGLLRSPLAGRHRRR